MMDHRSVLPWWREAGETGTKQLYQPESSWLFTMYPPPPFWGGCLSSLLETIAPSLLQWEITKKTSLCMEGVMRLGAQAQAASYTTSTCGPCAGRLAIRSSPLLAEVCTKFTLLHMWMVWVCNNKCDRYSAWLEVFSLMPVVYRVYMVLFMARVSVACFQAMWWAENPDLLAL
jgi:hypothetical protein